MSRFFLAPGFLTVVNRGCFCAIVFYTMWYTVGFQIRHQSLTSQDLLDYALNYERSRLVMEQLAYPPWSSGLSVSASKHCSAPHTRRSWSSDVWRSLDGLADGRDPGMYRVRAVSHAPVSSSCEVCTGLIGTLRRRIFF
jgi:hypothetical protein